MAIPMIGALFTATATPAVIKMALDFSNIVQSTLELTFQNPAQVGSIFLIAFVLGYIIGSLTRPKKKDRYIRVRD